MPRRLPKKAAEIMNALARQRAFFGDIEKLRAKHGIPSGGFKDQGGEERWRRSLCKNPSMKHWYSGTCRKKHLAECDLDCGFLTTRHGYPTFYSLVKEYVLHGERADYDSVDEPSVFCDLEMGMDDRGLVAELKIRRGASFEYVRQYLQKHWSIIGRHLKSPRTRASRNTERDRLVRALWSKNREQLGLTRGERKDQKIAFILTKEFGMLITPDNVRKIAGTRRVR